ncbi:MAG TPA: DEAD/DEAH box helicase [Myxococcota bacterium]|jgi:superfamily II DNA or RNA helicase
MAELEKDPLFDAVRVACSPSAWSRGVELVRADAVLAEPAKAGEVALRVATRAGLVSHLVTLRPESAEWDCDCAGRDDACEHVAAAVIALRRARQQGQDLRASEAGRVGYRLTRAAAGLALERVVVTVAGETPLLTSLVSIASGRVTGPAFVATPADLEVERVLGTKLRGPLSRGVLHSLLAPLSACEDLTLDGRKVRASTERVGLVVRVEDDGDGFRVVALPDPRITGTLADGVVLRGDTLCPAAPPGLSGRELEDLSRGQRIEAGDVARLVTEVLPSLRSRLPVEIATQRLPRTVELPPRIRLEVRRLAETLDVLPTLVYGEPPIARIDAGRLVSLGGPVPLRNEAEERRLVAQLAQDLELVPGHRVRVTGAEAIDLAARISRFRGEIRGDALQAFAPAPPLTASLRVGEQDFDVVFESAPAGGGRARRADPARVLKAWRAGENFVSLQGGGLAPLPADWLARYGDRVADLLAARGERGALPRCALPDLARLCDELGAPRPPGFEALRALVEGFTALPHAPLPADLRAELRPYQKVGVDWLCFLRSAGLGGVLADDMGLGKTLQALCALHGRTLVVAPTSVLFNWSEEIARFRPGLRASLYHGPDRVLDPEADVTLTSYALLRLDVDALTKVAWDSVILDEAQTIKNPDSQVARAAHRLDAGFRVTLSGTPVENRLEELWSQLHFTNPGLLGSREDFSERVARPVADGDEQAAARLRERIRPFVLRRLKREVAPELPPRTEVVLHAVLSEEERALYDAVRAATREDVVQQLGSGGNVLAALEALLRLRQAACHPGLVPGGPARESSAKLDLLLEFLEDAVADGHKALVFSQWTSLLDRVEPVLQAAGIGFLRLDGSTRDRGAVAGRFQSEGGPPVLLISLGAGGLGLNLTAADHVFILDPWWNPAVEDQAADRAHRIGQERPVMIYRLVAQDTVEERVLALQQHKRGLAAAALSGASGAASITREDLLALLA